MPPSSGKNSYNFILVMLCEVSNFLVVCPLKTARTIEICKAINKSFIKYFSPPTHIMCDQDPAFMSTMAQVFFQHFGIRVITVSTTNHKSLLAEHGIKSLGEILKCHLGEFGRDWVKFLDFAMLVYNSYSTPNLDGFCPFELVFGRKPNVLPLTEAMPEAPVTGSFREYYSKLREKLEYMRRHLVQFRDKRINMLNRNRDHQGFFLGQIVYAYLPSGAVVQTGSQKVRVCWVGPLMIMESLSPCQFRLMTVNGEPFRGIYEETRLKAGWLKTSQGPVNNLADYKRILRSNLNPLPPLQ